MHEFSLKLNFLEGGNLKIFFHVSLRIITYEKLNHQRVLKVVPLGTSICTQVRSYGEKRLRSFLMSTTTGGCLPGKKGLISVCYCKICWSINFFGWWTTTQLVSHPFFWEKKKWDGVYRINFQGNLMTLRLREN